MKNGFIKVCGATPQLRIADPAYNLTELLRITEAAADAGVRVLVFPELALTGATCGDLFFSDTLLSGAQVALERYLAKTRDFDLISFIGLPLRVGQALYNAVAVCRGGKLLGFVPKATPSPILSDGRWFAFDTLGHTAVQFGGGPIPFGRDLIFTCHELPTLSIGVEFGDDLFAPVQPSITYTAAGATLICTPAAFPESVGAASARANAVILQSTRTCSAYLMACAGEGESTTDSVFGGQILLAELGKSVSEKPAFAQDTLLISEIDVSRIAAEQRRSATRQSVACREIFFDLPITETTLSRVISRSPFIPNDPVERNTRFESILQIQATGLAKRVERAYAKKLVLGISGGLDSTLALLVMVRAIDALGRDRRDILAVTMPCFGTTRRTKNNATLLCEELGVDFRQVDIFDAVNQHFSDIGHDPDDRNVTYENSQARERTQILMDIANDCGGLVVGTGDLSELALGWATYNGDHMSMYAVNADIPKTLVRHLVNHVAQSYADAGSDRLAAALWDILDTPVSPELLPANEGGEIAQKTEDLVGPYELHDFYLYHLLRYGASPTKLYRLAKAAFGADYDDETLKSWLKVFLRRFFNQQFKRSCMPDGPRVGSVALSPRGAWCMPSDASSALWLSEAERL